MDPEFVAAVARAAHGEKINVARFCHEHGVSRDTFYKYVTRFRAEGASGFTRRSTAPAPPPQHPRRGGGRGGAAGPQGTGRRGPRQRPDLHPLAARGHRGHPGPVAGLDPPDPARPRPDRPAAAQETPDPPPVHLRRPQRLLADRRYGAPPRRRHHGLHPPDPRVATPASTSAPTPRPAKPPPTPGPRCNRPSPATASR
ncbi:helix-turn-helix domain-containing protein [Amycolatopsis sp. RTGN1]|uniref:helix-turn-helix domain-containing protein n=1 Tax=Amycolatopsis ponsaeliensis TaxID=2992142 RepID=UPI00254B166F|nr:helix-turn-helix domain-containing protein [Amycolatopsis sp. RTGN1]